MKGRSHGLPCSLMIRYIAYIGTKNIKRVENHTGGFYDFPKGQTVDVHDMKLTQEHVKDLLRSGLFKLMSTMDQNPKRSRPAPTRGGRRPVEHMRPPRHICFCGYVGTTLGGLNEHRKECHSDMPIKLNLGCGAVIKDGFVNIDIRKLEGVDIVHDVSDLSDLGLGGVGYILADDILEHFPQRIAERILAHWVSLLLLEGVIEIRCPDILHAVKVAPDDDWLIRLIYGGQDYPENFHRTGFTLATMTNLLKGLGLTIIHEEQTSEGNMIVKARK